jgi:DNA-binding transcriptional ArsR family regulator
MSKVTSVEFAKALADGTRQKIMQACCCGWRSVNELVEEMGVSQPTVSHHLAILKEAELVNVRHEGKQTFYTLNQGRVVSCCGQLMVTFAPQEKATAAVSKVVP